MIELVVPVIIPRSSAGILKHGMMLPLSVFSMHEVQLAAPEFLVEKPFVQHIVCKAKVAAMHMYDPTVKHRERRSTIEHKISRTRPCDAPPADSLATVIEVWCRASIVSGLHVSSPIVFCAALQKYQQTYYPVSPGLQALSRHPSRCWSMTSSLH